MLRVADRRPPAHLNLFARFLPLAALLLLVPFGPPILEALRFLDSGICAQLPTHMLAPGGVTLPLCARNTGIYTGAALAFGVLRAQGRWRSMLPPPPLLVALLLTLMAAMAIDGLNSVAADLALPHPYPPTNAVRLATGLGAGAALALLLSPVIARARYGGADRRPPLGSAIDLLPFGAAAVLAFPLIWSGGFWTLYPVALVSNAGLLGVLGGINRVALSAITGLARPTPRSSPGCRAAPAALALLSVAELAVLAGTKLLLLGPVAMGA
jgi:uncharacterized membrane protein